MNETKIKEIFSSNVMETIAKIIDDKEKEDDY